jgi:predicted RNA binding protein YcfA (HicA-like mRNA interferase family)
MSHLGPIKRRELIARLRRMGFTGPYVGGRHEFMQRGGLSLTIPNPHGGDIGPGFLANLLRQARITREEWEQL